MDGIAVALVERRRVKLRLGFTTHEPLAEEKDHGQTWSEIGLGIRGGVCRRHDYGIHSQSVSGRSRWIRRAVEGEASAGPSARVEGGTSVST